MSAPQVVEFLEFVEGQKNRSVQDLLDKVLTKSRLLTKAEAGTIFLARQRGKQRWLEPASVQNDRIAVRRADFVVPFGPGTIAGYVAHTGRTVVLDDVYALPKRSSFSFDPSREHRAYKTRSMFCFALKNYQDKIIGVVQLINCRPRQRRAPTPFAPGVGDLVAPISRVIGHSIERAAMLEEIKAKNTKLRDRNRQLDEQRVKIVDLQAETEDAFQLSIQLLARAAEIHDEETGDHIVRVNEYSYFIAKQLGMAASWCDEIRYSAQLHDVGKMSVDSAVLKKKGGLNPEERTEMNRHTVYGYRILAASPRLKMGAEIALNHHEKWDGTGYPNSAKGEAIPLSARIVQVADIYDALRSERPYKPAFSHAEAVKIITEGDERIEPRAHFDPQLIDLFAGCHQEFGRIWDRLHD
ncbi:MAG: GAF and HD-GYP domain-containing protein [Candidatus Binatia bacterium]